MLKMDGKFFPETVLSVCIHKAELEQADGVVYTLIDPLYFDVQDMTTNMENIEAPSKHSDVNDLMQRVQI